jgi:hypothetical protein
MGASKSPVPITDILDLCQIDYQRSRSSVNIPCPICDGARSDRKHKRLNVRLDSDVFRCPKCDTGGGAVAFYGFMVKGIDPDIVKNDKEVYKDLLKEIKEKTGSVDLYQYQQKQTYEKKPVDFPPTDVVTRDETYSGLFETLSLSDDHYNNLIERGLRQIDIEKNGYVTTPIIGIKKIPSDLRHQGLDLTGVPGFFKKDNAWSMIQMGRGIYIPVRDLSGILERDKGYIQGVQVRLDNPTHSNKYMWLSSRDYESGCGAETWCHFAGYPEETVYLTEGPLKADIIYRFINKPVIAVPGVNALKHLDPLFEDLKRLGVKKIRTAFDMDFKTNPHVQKGYAKLIEKIASYGFEYDMLTWDENYKGYDDYLLHVYLENGGKLDPKK